jgi:hypothetical protein
MLRFGKLISAVAGLTLCAAAGVSTAQAADITWNTYENCGVGSLACSSNGREFLGSDGQTTVTAQAWSYNPSSGSIGAASAGYWEGWGLGVINSGEDGTSPNHSVDNYGRYDMMAFFFSDVVDLTSVSLKSIYTGSFWGDTDITAWISTVSVAPDLTGESLTDLDAMFGDRFHQNGPRSNTTHFFGTNGGAGNLLIVGAQTFDTDRDDYFKIKALTADIYTQTPPPDTGNDNPVPAPGSMTIFGLGVAGFAYMRRRNARKDADNTNASSSIKSLIAGLKGLVARAKNSGVSANVSDNCSFPAAAR